MAAHARKNGDRMVFEEHWTKWPQPWSSVCLNKTTLTLQAKRRDGTPAVTKEGEPVLRTLNPACSGKGRTVANGRCLGCMGIHRPAVIRQRGGRRGRRKWHWRAVLEDAIRFEQEP